MKKRILSMLLALVMLATLLPLGLIDTAEAATGAQILTPTSGTNGTGANGGTWKCSSAGDTLTLTNYNGYPIETDATTIRFSGTNTITVPLSNLSGARQVYGLKLTSTKDIWIRGEDGGSLNIMFKSGNGTEDVNVSGIDAEGPLLINTAGDITISAPYGYPYGIRARQGLDYSGSGALDITVKGSYFIQSQHWCAAYGIAAEKGAISLSGSGSKTIRVQSSATSRQISSTPYGIYHGGGTGSSGTATVSVDTGALHIEMNGDGCGIYNMGSADSAYVNINNVPELSIEKADSAIETAHSGTVNVRNSKLRIANGRYAIRNSGGTINMENADVTAAVRGSDAGYTDAAVYTGTLQVKGSSTVDMTATYGTVVYARAVSVNLSNGSFTAKTGQSEWPPIDAPVTLGAKTRLMTGVCSDVDAGKYAGEKVDDLYVTSFASVESGTCGENVKWTLTKDGTLTISGTGAMTDYVFSDGAPWYDFRSQVKSVIMENGVTSIGNKAFYDCSSLTSVTIPSSVTSIGSCAFRGCTSLAHVTIPSSVTSIRDDTFYNCSSLTSVTIPDGVTSIGSWAFSGCSSLTRITIPNSVTSIGWKAFKGCKSLTSMTIPNSVTSIGDSAFYGCSSLTSVKLPSALQWINSEMFSNCVRLTSVTIPKSVTSIDDNAFHCCESLADVYYGGSKADWKKITIKIGNEDLQNATLHAAPAAPATVTLGTAKAGANGIKVTWTQTEGAVKYNVYRRTADTKWTSTPLATVSGTSFTDKTVKAGETYIYTVRGIASDGKSLSTGYDKNGVTATALPATVKLTGAKASGSSIVVTWSKAEGAVRYRVYRQAAGESSWTTLTSSATGTSYTDKKAKAGVTYTYTVRALNAANGLSAGYDKNGVKAIIAPATVTLGTAKAGASGITVTWAKAEGAVKYNVYRRTADTKWTSAPLATVDGTSYVDKTAKAGVKYIYTVRGVASDGKTLSGGYDKTGVTATALPATVKLTGAKVSGSSIVVTWSKAEGAVKYRVYRKSAGTDWTTLTSSATGTSYTDKTVKAGVKYTYTVRALNSVNGLSGGYDKNGVSAVIAPAKVVLVSARADSAGILVTWKAASGAYTYQVYRKTASDGWKLVAKNISDTEWKDTSAVKGTTYTYTVRAVADDGTTRGACDTRGKSAAVTKASTTPANVTMGKATAGKKGITVTWSYAADAKTYNVYRQAAGEKTWTAVAKNVNGKSWTDTKVTKGTKYTYMVRGVSANGKALSRDCTATVSATAK